MVKGGEQQVLSVTQSYKASIWCLCFIKNLFFFPLSLTKPPWRTKLTNTPPRWNLEKLDMRDQMLLISPVVGNFFVFVFLNQINVKGNDILITATLIRQNVFSVPSRHTSRGKPTQSWKTEAVWEAGAACKVRSLWPRTPRKCWELLVYTSAEAFPVRSCVSMLATNSGHPFSFLGSRSRRAAPCWGHGRAAPPPPHPSSCGGKPFRRMLRFGASTPRYPTVTSRS